MRKNFSGFYRPTDEEFESLWNECLFILDANVLLNLYRYSANTSSELIDILDLITDRLWLPFQVASEYQANRLEVISNQKRAYNDIENFLKKSQGQIESKFNNFLKHPLIDIKPLLNRIDSLFQKIRGDLNKQEKDHPDLILNDTLRERITTIFDGKVGQEHPPEKLQTIYEDGEKRFLQRVPPGFMDADKKTDHSKYGDLILWYEIIGKAIEAKKPVIFVTDDTKEDWWWEFEGKTIGPRPELIKEFISKTNKIFYMYSSDQFMEFARQHLRQRVEQTAIDEIREFIKSDKDATSKLMLISFEEQNKKIAKNIIDLYNEHSLYEDRKYEIQNEITTIVMNINRMDLDKNKYNKESYENSFNRLKYLKRELRALEERCENINNNIEELKYKMASNDEHKESFKEHLKLREINYTDIEP